MVDSFKPVYGATIEFTKSHEPTLQNILPSLQFCIEEMRRIEVGQPVTRENDKAVRRSLYPLKMCGLMMRYELKKVEMHDMWLVACFIFSYLRKMAFRSDEQERHDFKQRTEAIFRK